MDNCPPGKYCPHQRAFEFALQYFSTDTTEDIKMLGLLRKRYLESLRRQRIVTDDA